MGKKRDPRKDQMKIKKGGVEEKQKKSVGGKPSLSIYMVTPSPDNAIIPGEIQNSASFSIRMVNIRKDIAIEHMLTVGDVGFSPEARLNADDKAVKTEALSVGPP